MLSLDVKNALPVGDRVEDTRQLFVQLGRNGDNLYAPRYMVDWKLPVYHGFNVNFYLPENVSTDLASETSVFAWDYKNFKYQKVDRLQYAVKGGDIAGYHDYITPLLKLKVWGSEIEDYDGLLFTIFYDKIYNVVKLATNGRIAHNSAEVFGADQLDTSMFNNWGALKAYVEGIYEEAGVDVEVTKDNLVFTNELNCGKYYFNTDEQLIDASGFIDRFAIMAASLVTEDPETDYDNFVSFSGTTPTEYSIARGVGGFNIALNYRQNVIKDSFFVNKFPYFPYSFYSKQYGDADDIQTGRGRAYFWGQNEKAPFNNGNQTLYAYYNRHGWVQNIITQYTTYVSGNTNNAGGTQRFDGGLTGYSNVMPTTGTATVRLNKEPVVEIAELRNRDYTGDVFSQTYASTDTVVVIYGAKKTTLKMNAVDAEPVAIVSEFAKHKDGLGLFVDRTVGAYPMRPLYYQRVEVDGGVQLNLSIYEDTDLYYFTAHRSADSLKIDDVTYSSIQECIDAGVADVNIHGEVIVRSGTVYLVNDEEEKVNTPILLQDGTADYEQPFAVKTLKTLPTSKTTPIAKNYEPVSAMTYYQNQYNKVADYFGIFNSYVDYYVNGEILEFDSDALTPPEPEPEPEPTGVDEWYHLMTIKGLKRRRDNRRARNCEIDKYRYTELWEAGSDERRNLCND